MATSSLACLEERLDVLEAAVMPGDCGGTDIIDSLSSINVALNSLASSRERVNLVFKKVPELQEYLRPGFVEEEELDVSAQRDYILLIEDEIIKITHQLERIRELSSVLDSKPIQGFHTHVPKVNQLNLKQLDQLEKTDGLANDVANLLNQYNQLTLQLSQHFVQLDQVITNLEQKKIREAEDS